MPALLPAATLPPVISLPMSTPCQHQQDDITLCQPDAAGTRAPARSHQAAHDHSHPINGMRERAGATSGDKACNASLGGLRGRGHYFLARASLMTAEQRNGIESKGVSAEESEQAPRSGQQGSPTVNRTTGRRKRCSAGGELGPATSEASTGACDAMSTDMTSMRVSRDTR